MDCSGNHDRNGQSATPLKRTGRWWAEKSVILAFFAIGGFYLIAEHRAHLFGLLPYGLLLLCPLMHFFMHKGHGHGGTGQ